MECYSASVLEGPRPTNGATRNVAESLRLPVDGVFVVGMSASGIDILADALSRLGADQVGDREADRLGEFNGRLMASAGDPPDPAPVELAHSLAATWLDEARREKSDPFRAGQSEMGGRPWLWADWRLSFLTPFWSTAWDLRPAVILINREPSGVIGASTSEFRDRTDALTWWDRCNRSALVLCSMYPSLVVNYDELTTEPKSALARIVEFLNQLGLSLAGDVGAAVEAVEGADSVVREPADRPHDIDARHTTLHRLLHELGDRAVTGDDDAAGLIDVTSQFYDKDYYGTSYDQSGIPYSRDHREWLDYFGGLAASIVSTLHPASVLDVGCAVGMLIEGLRGRGVDARGIDISAWAIGQVPPALRPYCRVASATDELDGSYELITCFEVLEHLPPSLADAAIGNICRHAESVLFASTPDDFDEPTHLNVEPGSYWAQHFLHHGFMHDVDYDASYIAPHAMLFRRTSITEELLVADYERALWETKTELRSTLADHRQLADDHENLAVKSNALEIARNQLQQEVTENALEVANVTRRRAAENLAAYQMVRSVEADQKRLATLVKAREEEIAAVYNTRIFRYGSKLRSVYARLRGRTIATGMVGVPVLPPDGSYQTWVELFDTLDTAARGQLAARVQALPDRPTISVLMPTYNPPLELLRTAIESVKAQIYQDWELCIADDCSTDPGVMRVLQELAASDSRIKIVQREENGHISAASNSALSIATGEWVALLDHDDLLAEHALALIAIAIGENPAAGLVYSDEDKIDEGGLRRDPFFKPDFDPLLLLGQNFVSHLSAFRKDLVEGVGGYRLGYEGSQDWDLTLRVSEQLSRAQVVHIPHVLYHWRTHAASTASLVSAKPYAVDAGRRAVADHLARTSRPGKVVRIGKSGHNRVSWELPDSPPSVSIVIPTKDGRLLPRCLDSVLSFTTYPDFEVLVVDNSSEHLPTLQYLAGLDDRLRVIRDERPFNYAELNNAAVDRTTGEFVCLLNDDTEVINPDWLTELVTQALDPEVGAVGAKLYYDESRIQHAGVVLGIYGVAGHTFRMFDRLSPGYFGNLQLARRMSAVTAACLLVRREAWDQVDGMDGVNLPIAFNDVDFCLRLREAGWEIVWSPYAEMYHHESTTRGADDGPRADAFKREVNYMESRWGFDTLRRDPYYNPNLSLDGEDYSLAWPPRISLL